MAGAVFDVLSSDAAEMLIFSIPENTELKFFLHSYIGEVLKKFMV